MNQNPKEPNDEGQDVPMPSESDEKGPYRFPADENDKDTASDNPAEDIDDDVDDNDDDVDGDMDQDDDEIEPDGQR